MAALRQRGLDAGSGEAGPPGGLAWVSGRCLLPGEGLAMWVSAFALACALTGEDNGCVGAGRP